MSRTALAILSTRNLLHNLSVIKKYANNTKIIAMVKANAYGHGLRSVSLRLANTVDMFGVASIDEAMILRDIGIQTPIILMEGIFEYNELAVASTHGFHVVFHESTQIQWLNNAILDSPINAWIKVDSGMGRLGFHSDIAIQLYHQLAHHPLTHKPIRIMSHFACANTPHHPLNQKQKDTFSNIIKSIKTEYSFCNSAAIIQFPECHYDFIRPGIALYGVSPFDTALHINLKPVMTLQTKIISIHIHNAGDSIGYGGRFICPEDMPVGIAAIGYGDGYPQIAKENTPVLINNTICSIIGSVSMDMITIDLRPCQNAQVGDKVVLWGDGLPIEKIAQFFPYTSTYEMLTRIQHRVKFLWDDSE